MKELIPMVFILFGVTFLIFFGFGTANELMNSADAAINSTSTLNTSFEMASNSTIGAFSIMSNIPLLLVVIIVFIVLFAFVGLSLRR